MLPHLFPLFISNVTSTQCDQKKSPNVYKNCLNDDFNRNDKDFDTFTKIA